MRKKDSNYGQTKFLLLGPIKKPKKERKKKNSKPKKLEFWAAALSGHLTFARSFALFQERANFQGCCCIFAAFLGIPCSKNISLPIQGISMIWALTPRTETRQQIPGGEEWVNDDVEPLGREFLTGLEQVAKIPTVLARPDRKSVV